MFFAGDATGLPYSGWSACSSQDGGFPYPLVCICNRNVLKTKDEVKVLFYSTLPDFEKSIVF